MWSRYLLLFGNQSYCRLSIYSPQKHIDDYNGEDDCDDGVGDDDDDDDDDGNENDNGGDSGSHGLCFRPFVLNTFMEGTMR